MAFAEVRVDQQVGLSEVSPGDFAAGGQYSQHPFHRGVGLADPIGECDAKRGHECVLKMGGVSGLANKSDFGLVWR